MRESEVVEGHESTPDVGLGGQSVPSKEKKEKRRFYFFDTIEEVNHWRDVYLRDERTIFLQLPYLVGRECALLSASGRWANARHMKVHTCGFYKSNMNAFDMMNRDYMIYYSIAGYYNHPTFSYNPTERQRQQKEWTDGVRNEAGELISPAQMSKYIISYELFFDFDNSGRIYSNIRRSPAWKDCKVLSDDLDKFGVRYRINFSGSGFHLVIPYEQFSSIAGDLKNLDFIQDGTVYNFCMRVRKRIVDMLALASVDLTVIDASRLAKCVWSFTKYATIAIPCETKAQFDHFDVRSCDPRRVLARQDLYMKGKQYTQQGTPTGFLQYLEKRLKKW